MYINIACSVYTVLLLCTSYQGGPFGIGQPIGFFLRIYVSVSAESMPHTYEELRRLERVSDSLELELEAVVSCLMLVLGTEFESSAMSSKCS